MTEERRQHIARMQSSNQGTHQEVREIGRRVIAQHQEALMRLDAYDRGEIKLSGQPRRHCI